MNAVRLRRAGSRFLAGLLAVAVAGCGIRVVVGRRPDVNLLETTLKVGGVDANRCAAGAWRTGRSQHVGNADRGSADEGSLKDVRQFFLFVYFVEDRYDGYLWFSSIPK